MLRRLSATDSLQERAHRLSRRVMAGLPRPTVMSGRNGKVPTDAW